MQPMAMSMLLPGYKERQEVGRQSFIRIYKYTLQYCSGDTLLPQPCGSPDTPSLIVTYPHMLHNALGRGAVCLSVWQAGEEVCL